MSLWCTVIILSLLSGLILFTHFWPWVRLQSKFVILTKFSSLAVLKVVNITTFGAASDENFVKLTAFPGVHELYCRAAKQNTPHLITWWRHQMETFSALLALCAGKSPVPVNFPHKGQWRRVLMFSLIYAWIHDWINNSEAGDLRRQRGHYDVIVMHRPCAYILEQHTLTLAVFESVHNISLSDIWYESEYIPSGMLYSAESCNTTMYIIDQPPIWYLCLAMT